VEQGGIVIGLKPTSPLGIIPARLQAKYMQIADRMWSGCAGDATVANFGKGRIYCPECARGTHRGQRDCLPLH
jgi:hypothetical protein